MPENLPSEISWLVGEGPLYDSSCSPEARVYFLDREGGYYIKRGARGALTREAEMTSYFHKKGLGAEVLLHLSSEYDWLVTRRVIGEDCTHEKYLSDPKRLCDTLATDLRSLHELDFSDCPKKDKMTDYLGTAKRNFDLGLFDPTFILRQDYFKSSSEAFGFLSENASAFSCDVLLHGDFCLPNVILDNWRLSGYIDLGGAGVGDRHIDLFWGSWTLNFNLGTDEYRERFFDAYGRDLIDKDKLLLVSVAEAFG